MELIGVGEGWWPADMVEVMPETDVGAIKLVEIGIGRVLVSEWFDNCTTGGLKIT